MPILVYKIFTFTRFVVSYPGCVSLLLDHIHARQLVWEKAASPQSRVTNLKATRQGSGRLEVPGNDQPSTFPLFVLRRVTRKDDCVKVATPLGLVSHVYSLGRYRGTWKEILIYKYT